MHVGKKDTKGIDCHSTAEHLFLLDFSLFLFCMMITLMLRFFLPAMSPINLRGIESSSPTKFQHVYLRVPCISPASAGLLSTSYSLLNEAPLGTLSKREWHLLIEWWFVISQFSLSNLSTMCVCVGDALIWHVRPPKLVVAGDEDVMMSLCVLVAL